MVLTRSMSEMRELRQSIGLSQRECAALLGVPVETFRAWAVGDSECTITFDTVQGMGFDTPWEEDTDYGPRVFRKNVTERVELSGTAKSSFTEGGNEVSEVSLLTLDQNTFALSEAPFGWW